MSYYNFLDLIIEENLCKALQKWGLEGTLERIELLYKNNPKIKSIFLKKFYKKFEK